MSNENTSLALTAKDLDPVKQRFVELVDEKTFLREASFAIQLMNGNAYLGTASKQSVQMAVLNVAQIGLSLNPALKLAYLVPRKMKRGQDWVLEAQLMPSYQGLVKLITDAGTVRNIAAHLIWEGDDVEIDMASLAKVAKHRPYVITGKPKGELRGVYSLATLADGSMQVETMSKEEVFAIRETSESWRNRKEGVPTIWTTHEGEMFRKTVIRRHFKYLPKSGNFEKLATAIKLDESDYEMSAGQVGMIETLLQSAEIDQSAKDRIFNEISSMSYASAVECIKFLKECQPSDTLKYVAQQARGEVNRPISKA
jgi:recombination protein RecT